ncbi:hypothetical protein [Streptomyces sp. 136MFCol5.1]|uniref:hypothetical protein n=1 Tax=Streptomyces sp. 136MFCol5.1 TaxID=1172182 RepID=UPI00115FB42A|nr:hypothetical protein [Streptomyces sp. 136MFCol5.1]
MGDGAVGSRSVLLPSIVVDVGRGCQAALAAALLAIHHIAVSRYHMKASAVPSKGRQRHLEHVQLLCQGVEDTYTDEIGTAG